jgi:hypothetical protein
LLADSELELFEVGAEFGKAPRTAGRARHTNLLINLKFHSVREKRSAPSVSLLLLLLPPSFLFLPLSPSSLLQTHLVQ